MKLPPILKQEYKALNVHNIDMYFGLLKSLLYLHCGFVLIYRCRVLNSYNRIHIYQFNRAQMITSRTRSLNLPQDRCRVGLDILSDPIRVKQINLLNIFVQDSQVVRILLET